MFGIAQNKPTTNAEQAMELSYDPIALGVVSSFDFEGFQEKPQKAFASIVLTQYLFFCCS